MKYKKFLLTVLIALCSLSTDLSSAQADELTQADSTEQTIPLTEDLMREHGLLNRILLIYEEIGKRIDTNVDFPIAVLAQSSQIVQSFIHQYHEKLEENYLFPLFEKRKKEMRLVKTLKNQHAKGREVTAQVQKLAGQKVLDKAAKKTVKNLLQKFVKMYRPHEAREDTILFPQVRSLMSQERFDGLSQKFDQTEDELFGEHGFELMLEQVANLEKELGIYNLDQFTPQLTA